MLDKYIDHNLKIPSSYYELLCIPLRTIIAGLFLFDTIPKKYYKYISIIYVLIAFGLYRKWTISGNSWKVYPRAILIYLMVAMLLQVSPENNKIIGMLLFIDVLMGMQSKYIFSRLQ